MSIFSAPSNAKIFMQNVAHYVPMGLQEYLYDNLPGKGLDKARANRVAAHKVANQLLEEKNEELATGKAARDVMSILSMFYVYARTLAYHSPLRLGQSGITRWRLEHRA